MNLILLLPVFYLIPVVTALVTKKYLPVITIISFFISAAASLIHSLIEGLSPVQFEIIWFQSGDATFFIRLFADQTSIILIIFSTLIAFSVSFFSMAYLMGKEGQQRFFITLSVFMFFMCGLFLSGDILLSFFCWELIGVCSYLLIGFYRETQLTGKAATKALLFNKVGDIGFLVALMGIWIGFGSFEISEISRETTTLTPGLQMLISIGLLSAVIAKSAQFPLHGWLPEAMTGPSPVSALIHSATMVAAGIFLICRLHFLFPENILHVAGSLGMITALLGSWNALFQVKIKQVLAWSTISQLGIMLMGAGWGNPDAALGHLISHGFFKAGLFLVAGYLLKSIEGESENELQAIAQSKNKDRVIAITAIIFAASLVGIPLSGSFLTKEAIATSLPFNALLLFYLINSLTAIYTFRLLWILKPYFGGSMVKKLTRYNIPIALLMPFTGWWIWSVNPLHSNDHFGMTPPANFIITASSIGVILFAFITGRWLLRNNRLPKSLAIQLDILYHPWTKNSVVWFSVLVSKADRLMLDRILHFIAFTQVTVGHLTAAADRYLVDGFARNISIAIGAIGNLIRKISNGNIQTYLWWGLTAILILVIWQS